MELVEPAKLTQVKDCCPVRRDCRTSWARRCVNLLRVATANFFRGFNGEIPKVIVRLAIILLLCTTSASLAEDGSPSPLEERGHALAERMCSQCHAIGKSGQSPHGAPAFRALDRRVDLDSFMERLREGLTVAHPDMPAFRFTREDARAFLLYLRSIQAQ